jgi:hypothetical protein
VPHPGTTAQPAAGAQRHPDPTHDKPAEAVFENIKSLKGIPSDEVIPSMQFFSAALGVGCEHCHVIEQGRRDFPNDDKKAKQTARQMIAMVKQINETSFKGEQEVTCATCHNGKPNPQRVAPLATAETLKDVRIRSHGSTVLLCLQPRSCLTHSPTRSAEKLPLTN